MKKLFTILTLGTLLSIQADEFSRDLLLNNLGIHVGVYQESGKKEECSLTVKEADDDKAVKLYLKFPKKAAPVNYAHEKSEKFDSFSRVKNLFVEFDELRAINANIYSSPGRVCSFTERNPEGCTSWGDGEFFRYQIEKKIYFKGNKLMKFTLKHVEKADSNFNNTFTCILKN